MKCILKNIFLQVHSSNFQFIIMIRMLMNNATYYMFIHWCVMPYICVYIMFLPDYVYNILNVYMSPFCILDNVKVNKYAKFDSNIPCGSRVTCISIFTNLPRTDRLT